MYETCAHEVCRSYQSKHFTLLLLLLSVPSDTKLGTIYQKVKTLRLFSASLKAMNGFKINGLELHTGIVVSVCTHLLFVHFVATKVPPTV